MYDDMLNDFLALLELIAMQSRHYIAKASYRAYRKCTKRSFREDSTVVTSGSEDGSDDDADMETTVDEEQEEETPFNLDD
jgi:hypothetical protein